MRIGQIDPKYHAVHLAKQNLVQTLKRSIEPSFDEKELADAIEQFFDAKIATALDRRY
jgi:hypothetical protein